MSDPYKMVFINLICLLLIAGSILIFKLIYPKKKINFFLLTVIFSIPLIISIFRPGSYESGDFTIHIYRSIEFYRSLQEGIFMPSWAGGLNATYGYPLFIFNYPLPYYLIGFFHFLGFSFVLSLKIFLALNIVLSGIFMFLFTKNLFKNNLAAFTASIFYLFAPYHLIDVHFKIVIGEILIYTFLPLLFFFTYKQVKKANSLFQYLTILTIALLIMSHVVIALFIAILLICFSLFIKYTEKSKSFFSSNIITLFTGSILSIYIWLTPFFMSKYTILQILPTGHIDSRNLVELLYSPWRMGLLFQGPHGEIQNIIGYTQIFLILFFTIQIARKKINIRYRSTIIFWLSATYILIFLITNYADFFWKIIPFIGATGNHRLLVLVAFSISILAGYFALLFLKKTKIIYILIFITIIYTILNWGQRRVIPNINDPELISNVSTSTYKVEGHFYANSIYRDPKQPWFDVTPNSHLEITSGSGTIKEIERTTTHHEYIIDATTPLVIRENTLFFPGWTIKSNQKPVNISHDKNAVINFKLQKGLQLVEVNYEDLLIYKLLKIISCSGFIVVLLLLIKKFKQVFWR